MWAVAAYNVSKKAQQLSLNTVVIAIIVIVVLAILVLIYTKSSGSLFGTFGEQIAGTLDIVQ